MPSNFNYLSLNTPASSHSPKVKKQWNLKWILTMVHVNLLRSHPVQARWTTAMKQVCKLPLVFLRHVLFYLIVGRTLCSSGIQNRKKARKRSMPPTSL